MLAARTPGFPLWGVVVMRWRVATASLFWGGLRREASRAGCARVTRGSSNVYPFKGVCGAGQSPAARHTSLSSLSLQVVHTRVAFAHMRRSALRLSSLSLFLSLLSSACCCRRAHAAPLHAIRLRRVGCSVLYARPLDRSRYSRVHTGWGSSRLFHPPERHAPCTFGLPHARTVNCYTAL